MDWILHIKPTLDDYTTCPGIDKLFCSSFGCQTNHSETAFNLPEMVVPIGKNNLNKFGMADVSYVNWIENVLWYRVDEDPGKNENCLGYGIFM